VLADVRNCSKVILLHEDTKTAGMAAKRAGVNAGKTFEGIGRPIMLVTAQDTVVLISPIEGQCLPDVQKAAEAARQLASY
jgi:pyruvate/2-oxoglutarate/acetoin dehydrogenase E1 component